MVQADYINNTLHLNWHIADFLKTHVHKGPTLALLPFTCSPKTAPCHIYEAAFTFYFEAWTGRVAAGQLYTPARRFYLLAAQLVTLHDRFNMVQADYTATQKKISSYLKQDIGEWS
jgi:hypothetical protein